jgi:N-acetylmuramoyl-L-alanine amidase
MAKEHRVREGECVASIAFEHGFHPDTLWDHPDNADLKRLRGDPNVLLAGDALVIPDLRTKEVACATGRLHRFKRRGVPENLRLRLHRGGKPRADLEYRLEIDGAVRHGRTDGDGLLEAWIPPNARVGLLTLLESGEVLRLELGGLDPVDHLTGVQARLFNLGLYSGRVDGLDSPALRAAVRAFQVRQGLPETGEVDAATRSALREVHGA